MAISRYQKKISGPLLDRIDIHVEVPRVDYEKLADKCNVEDSKTIRYCQTDASGEKLLKAAVQQLHLSARAYHRVLKLARTIADLADSNMIAANHVAEAVQYRPRVGMYSDGLPIVSSLVFCRYWRFLAKRESKLDKYVIVCVFSLRGRYQILKCDM
jgi:predicted ATPase with chaperone activity